MNPTEYRAAIAALGLSQSAAGRFFGVHAITAHRWATGEGPPSAVAMLLTLMVELQFTPEYVERVIRPDRPSDAGRA